MPPEPSREEQLAAEALTRDQLGQQQQLFDPATGIPPARNIQDWSLAMEGLVRSYADVNTAMEKGNEIRQQAVEAEQELQALQSAKAQALKDVEGLQGRELAGKLKSLELTKEEDKLVANLRKNRVSADDPTVQRLKSAYAARQAMDKTGITSVSEAERIGGISARDASVLAGGPERAKRLFGVPTSEGIGGLARAATGNPAVMAAMAALSIGHGFQTMESTGAGGFLSTIPIIGGTLAGIANQIPGLQAATAFGATTRLGQVTGGGYRAGLGAQFDAFKMGANPFDIVSNQTATEIVAGARNAGFQGSMARAFESAMLDVYKQTGIDPATLASIGTLFAKGGQGGLDQFRSTMENIDNIARDSSQSVANVADQIQTLSQALSGTGAAPLGLAGSIVAAVSTVAGQLTPEQQKSLATGFFGLPGNQRFSGYPGATATAPSAIATANRMRRITLEAWKSNLKIMNPNAQAVFLGNLVDRGYFDSVDAARAAIMHGDQIIHRQSVETRRANARNAFAEAQHGVDHLMAAHPLLQYGTTEPRRAGNLYIDRLARNLRSDGFNAKQIEAITAPLAHVLHGDPLHRGRLDWTNAIADARKRAIMQSEAGKGQWWSGGASNQGRFLTVRFNGQDMRNWMSGKNVQKKIRLENSRDGSNTTVGTSFLDGG